MRFTLMSDVHIDINTWNWDLLKNADATIPMVVAGDISNDVMEASKWICDLRARFDRVIWLAGNHDHYNLGFHATRVYDPVFSHKWPYPKTVAEIYDHYQRWSNHHDIHFLHRNSVILDGVEFVGATGWHNFDAAPYLHFEDQVQAWQDSMNDARCIRWFDDNRDGYKGVLEAALDDSDYIRGHVKSNNLPKVVITHHIPHRNFVKVTTNHLWNLLNGSYVNTELETCMDPSIRAWCFGHTHNRVDKDLNGVRYLNNARGYPRENPSWTPVEVEVEV